MLELAPTEGLHIEALLAGAYALLLLAIAFGVERLAHRMHTRTQAYETEGFTYQPHLDAWQCPAGAHLLQVAIEHEWRLARYRAPATTCNHCPLKSGCTDSDQGRELTRNLDTWLESEIGRFHNGLALVLLVLAGLITSLALVRNHAQADILVLLPATLLILGLASNRFTSLFNLR
jgi:hypothetical protein